MKKIAVIGGNGQLGNCFRKLESQFNDRFEFDFTDSSTLDVTNTEQISDYFYNFKPDFCINASAYTAVDLAETETEKAYAVNAQGVANLAEACEENKATFIHISTDYVFDGKSYLPYTEDMPVNPSSVYGKSKLEGERILMEICPEAVIVRTSWLYSSFGNNEPA